MVLFILALAAPGYARTRPFPDTREGIHVFSDQFQSGMSEAQCAFAAAHYAGCQKMILGDVRRLRAHNPGFIVLHYQLGCGNGPALFIDGDAWTSDWPYVSAHESWFMHQGGSRLHMDQWDWYLMDISNPQYRNYWTAACIERMRRTECDGVFADSLTVDAYFGQLTPAHPWLSDIDRCLANWVPLLETYAGSIEAALRGAPEQFYFLPNLGGLVTGWDATNYAELGDGGMVEGFGIWRNESYFAPEDLRLQLDRILDLGRAGKIVICQSYTSDGALRERMFLTGLYLLVKGEHTYFNMMGAEHDAELLHYPEYGIPIGSYPGGIPGGIEELYDPATGCYRRDYSNGLVLVNPRETPLSVPALGAAYHLAIAAGGGSVNEEGRSGGALAYRTVTGIEIPAHGAAILLGEVPPAAHAVTLALDKAIYSTAESLTLHWGIEKGGSALMNTADAYVAAMTPSGKLYFYNGSFTARRAAAVRSLAVADMSGDLGPFPLAGLPAGEYTWYAVLVIPGGNPLESADWISNLASVIADVLPN